MKKESPRIMIAGLKGGSGKTLVATGVVAALSRRGLPVQPFKKGPDYIDASWLGRAAGRPCYNLDTFMTGEDRAARSFASRVSPDVAAIIEGNRGLFDGMDIEGSHSTARLAAILDAPVILTVDCTKSTRTVAAMVAGCINFAGDFKIAGVVLNRVAGIRHQDVVSSSIEKYCGIPVLGALPKLKSRPFPERHMGLIPPQEHDLVDEAIGNTAEVIEKCIDLDRLSEIIYSAAPIEAPDSRAYAFDSSAKMPKIGVARDSAFQFYYPENIEELDACGAAIIETSPLNDGKLPDIDALYIGGGFPETHAARLAANRGYLDSVKAAADGGMPIYAECGGTMYLGEKIVANGQEHCMAGVFPVTFGMEERPQRHGYTLLEVVRPNPFFEVGTEFRGHEFHYSRILDWKENRIPTAFGLKRGYGFDGKRDGMSYRNVVAAYTHVHALGAEKWAASFVKAAGEHRRRNLRAGAGSSV